MQAWTKTRDTVCGRILSFLKQGEPVSKIFRGKVISRVVCSILARIDWRILNKPLFCYLLFYRYPSTHFRSIPTAVLSTTLRSSLGRRWWYPFIEWRLSELQLNSAKKKKRAAALKQQRFLEAVQSPAERTHFKVSLQAFFPSRRLGNDVDSPLTARSGGDGGTGVAALYWSVGGTFPRGGAPLAVGLFQPFYESSQPIGRAGGNMAVGCTYRKRDLLATLSFHRFPSAFLRRSSLFAQEPCP